MGSRRPLIIHKTEWDRLKGQATTSVHYHKQLQKQDREYLKPLIEQSQNWIKSWPDTVQGHVHRVEKIKKQQYDKDIALIRSFVEKSKRDLSTGAIQRAKQQIFEDSCYGKQLLSALRESKTLEERDAQLKFKEQMKQKELDHNEIKSTALIQKSYLEFDKDAEEQNRLKKLKNIEIAQINRSIYKMKKEKRSREKEHERQMRKEDELLAKKFQEAEALAKEKETIQRMKDIVEYKEERKRQVMQKIKVEKLTKALDELWQKYHEKRQCKEKHIFNKLFKMGYETIESHKHYDLIQKLKENEKMEYEDFINKGIELHEKELKIKDEADSLKQEQKHENIKLLVQYNKIAAEQCKGVKCNDSNKDICDRQCILVKSRKNRKSPVYVLDVHKYLERLRKREVEPASWTGASAAHEQFAQFAKRTLQDSRYKLMAQKVIDNYIKVNHLDPTTFLQ